MRSHAAPGGGHGRYGPRHAREDGSACHSGGMVPSGHSQDYEPRAATTEPMPVVATRTKMQKFTPNILNYFTSAEWDRMQGQQSLGVAVDFLITRLHQLGGRCLSEPCKAWCSSLILSLRGLSNCTESTKQQVLEFFKKEYASRGRKAAKVEPCLVELPPPNELKENTHSCTTRSSATTSQCRRASTSAWWNCRESVADPRTSTRR